MRFSINNSKAQIPWKFLAFFPASTKISFWKEISLQMEAVCARYGERCSFLKASDLALI
jgi:hypothetical protein